MTTSTTPDLLAELVDAAREQTERRRSTVPMAALERQITSAPPTRDLAAALRAPGLGVIAELKPRSPLAGPLTDRYRPAELARSYTAGGAAALSVLAHEAGFGGRPEDLATVRAATELPVLRKDFIVDEYQVAEARALGADAVLLVIAALDPARYAELLRYAETLELSVLVEVHSAEEAEVALAAGARIVGVNHRNLRDFSIDLGLTGRLRPRIGAGRVLVAESGVRTPADATRLRADGADAVLVGETLMRSPDPEATVRALAAA
ncbi:indole-3-glycerol phosphate synthase [Kitasatospora sp. MAA4]|uniref:indole-3-glycerol phosphate synthase TrpC n=1 Tax=Kitasatospora sp. MAA4 TaxID=3035093 RepID=UPI0024769C19|nr:indole-3-glycerol phosphate synthase TrpC [Kitasatospora sp. MAA4]MDH6131731.1 indole-3-glycerol phosphate synthase [Kitasatospora sp. MAA4]